MAVSKTARGGSNPSSPAICIDKRCTSCHNDNMDFSIRFSEEKNQLLKAMRGVCFDDVVDILEQKKLLDDIAHPNKKYPKQRMYVVKFNKYVYAIPYVVDMKKKEIFLKTMYASRVLTKKYLKGNKK